MCDVRDCKKRGKHKVIIASHNGDLKTNANLCEEHYVAIYGGGPAYSIGCKIENETPISSYILYDRRELSKILKLLVDIYGKDHLAKAPELDDHALNTTSSDIVLLNRALWKLLGNGLEMHYLIMTPLEEIPLLINTYPGNLNLAKIIKLRLELGK